MNKLITNKITLTLIFVILCHFTVNAQDDSSKKVIVVVRPGHATQAAAASTTKYASTTPSITNKPASTKPALLANNNKATAAAAPGTQVNTTAGAQKSATVLASTAQKTPASMAGTTQKTPAVMASTATTKATTAAVVAATQKPAAAPYVTPGSRVHTYNAPSTAERTGVASYMHPVVTPSKQGAPVITAAVVPVSATGNAVSGATGNASKYAAASPAPHQAVITTTVPVIKRDTIVITKLKHDTVDTMPAKHRGNKILFAEIGGPGIAISINYDARFKSGQKDGFGYRVGVGYFAAGNNTVFTIPVQVNYLYGKDGKYLELGIGTTFINSRGDNYSSPTWEFDTVTGLAATAVIGVRYEPNKALNFRLGYVPIVSSYGLINAGGFSVGYTF
jgi:hypothetical protein